MQYRSLSKALIGAGGIIVTAGTLLLGGVAAQADDSPSPQLTFSASASASQLLFSTAQIGSQVTVRFTVANTTNSQWVPALSITSARVWNTSGTDAVSDNCATGVGNNGVIPNHYVTCTASFRVTESMTHGIWHMGLNFTGYNLSTGEAINYDTYSSGTGARVLFAGVS